MIKQLITTIEEFNTWWISEQRSIMAIDFETTSLKYLEMELDGFSMCNGSAACYVNFPIHKTYDMPSIFQDIDWTMRPDEALALVSVLNHAISVRCTEKTWEQQQDA